MRVAAYYRVSSGKQRDAHTIDSQRTAARALCASRGWELVAEFTDDGASARAGKLHKRPDFAAMLAGVRARQFEAVILVAFDRLTRSVDLGELGSILGTLQAAGVLVVSDGGEAIDLNTFGGRINALVRAQLAAEESVVKADRSRRGRDRVARLGRPPCRPPWGFRFDSVAGKWAESEGAKVVREAWARSAAGESNRTIAAEFHRRRLSTSRGEQWSHGVVARLLRNDVYVTGKWRANHDVVIDLPVLIDADTALAARKALQHRRTCGPKIRRGVYLLEGIAICAECQSKIRIFATISRGHTYRYYVCERVRHAKMYGTDRCHTPTHRVEATDARVWAAVSNWLAQPDLVSKFIEERGGAAGERAQQALADLGDWQDKLAVLPVLETEALRLREKGLLSSVALEARLSDLLLRKQLLEQQIETAKSEALGARLDAVEVRALERTLKELRGRCVEAVPEQRRELVRLLCPGGWTVSATTIEAEALFCPGVTVGTAYVNRDLSINVKLDAHPANNQLHIRDAELNGYQRRNDADGFPRRDADLTHRAPGGVS